ncbi:hypothetical protein LN042_06930 [Kitasatospora sp. RB6PN24]|uniref:hypothetical protein n=1 Tax=Kitasatospora humi TaxID=2893891 RepID=UPI001E3F9BEC|nr:hypothetical protein [Kitasatospora humi]MCC9306840.1 hypothetical protein [Kitasatospora humi]
MNAVPNEWSALAAKNAYLDTAHQLELSGVSPADLKVEVETLSEFKKKVDAMLTSLDDSDAAQPKISQQSLDQGHLGAFPDATNLLNAYDVVHQNLQTLSATLSQQIKAMSIALNININGYQEVDDEQRRALWNIYAETNNQYNSGVSPTGVVKPLDPQATASTTADSSSGTPASSTDSTQTHSGVVA